MNSKDLAALKPSNREMASEQYLKNIVLDYRQMKFAAEDIIIVDGGEGIRFKDVEGKWYLDGLSGVWVAGMGHQDKHVIETMKHTLDSYVFVSPIHGANPYEVRLANLLGEIAPGELNKAMILDSGSEATEVAMKMARQYHKVIGNHRKYKVLSFYRSYHGATFGAMSATGKHHNWTWQEPLMPGFMHVFSHNCYRCPFDQDYPGCDLLCAKMVERTIEMEGPDSVACMIIEPIINTQGACTPPPEYLPKLREICDRYDVLLIYDEIITGFGRTGELFAADTLGVTPDLIACGKGMTCGYTPLAACIFHDKIGEAFWGDDPDISFSHGHTYGGNMLSSATAIDVICEMLDRDLPGNARRMEPYVKAKFAELDEKYGVIGDIRGKGLMIAAEFVQDKATKQRFPGEIGNAIAKVCLRNGLLLRSEPDWVAIGCPLTVTEADLDEMFAILDASMAEVLGGYSAATPETSRSREDGGEG